MAKGKYAEKRQRAGNEEKQATTWAMDEDLLEHKEGAARLVDLDFEEQAARNAVSSVMRSGSNTIIRGLFGNKK